MTKKCNQKKPASANNHPPIPHSEPLCPPSELKTKQYTLVQIRRTSQRLKSLKKALEFGIPVETVCKGFACLPCTISVINSRFRELAAVGKRYLAAKFRIGRHVAIEAAIEAVQDGTMPPRFALGDGRNLHGQGEFAGW